MMVELGRLFLRMFIYEYERPELGRIRFKVELLKADPPVEQP